MSKHFWLLKTVQAGVGFSEADERRLTAVFPFIQPNKLSAPLPPAGNAIRPLVDRWARHNLLGPRDAIYAQRLWMLALAGLAVNVPLDILSGAVQSLYRQAAVQLPPATLADCEAALQKGMQADLSMLAQCYGRNRPPKTV